MRRVQPSTLASLCGTLLLLVGLSLVPAQDSPKSDPPDTNSLEPSNVPDVTTSKPVDPNLTNDPLNPVPTIDDVPLRGQTTSVDQVGSPRIVAFSLTNQSAKGLAEALHKIYPGLTFQADKHANSVIVILDSTAVQKRIEKFITFSELSPEEKAKTGLPEHVREFLGGTAIEMKRFVNAPSAPDIAGTWYGKGWGKVELQSTNPSTFEGSYADDTNPQSRRDGRLKLVWSVDEKKFAGTWADRHANRYGELTVRPLGKNSITGEFGMSDELSITDPLWESGANLFWSRVATDTEKTDPTQLPAKTPAADRYRVAEDHVRESSAALRNSAPKADEGLGQPQVKDVDRVAFKKNVRVAFEGRQALLRDEIAGFQKRLDRLSRTLEDREREKEAIIDRRVEELLNPNLRWDAPHEKADGVGAAGLSSKQKIWFGGPNSKPRPPSSDDNLPSSGIGLTEQPHLDSSLAANSESLDFRSRSHVPSGNCQGVSAFSLKSALCRQA